MAIGVNRSATATGPGSGSGPGRPNRLALQIPQTPPGFGGTNDPSPWKWVFQSAALAFQLCIPFLAPIAIAFVKSRSEKEKEALIEEHLTQLTCLKINHEKEIRMMCEKHEKEQLHASKEEASKSLLKGLEEISKEEEICAYNTLWKLASFERGIRNVLDIYCSPFKSKEDRMKHEKELLRNTFSQRFGNINMYNDLEHIFKYDQKHCGNTKEENGQLYQVYMKYWSSQIELFKYKNILHRFQTWSNIQGGQK